MGTWWSRGGREETQEMENKKGGCYSTPPTSFLFEDQDQNMFSKYLRHIWRIQCKTFVQNFVELVKLLSSAIDFFQFTSQADSQTRKYIYRVEAIWFCISANTFFPQTSVQQLNPLWSARSKVKQKSISSHVLAHWGTPQPHLYPCFYSFALTSPHLHLIPQI